MSSQHLADALAIHRSRLLAIERGHRKMLADESNRIAELLNVDVRWILGSTEHMGQYRTD